MSQSNNNTDSRGDSYLDTGKERRQRPDRSNHRDEDRRDRQHNPSHRYNDNNNRNRESNDRGEDRHSRDDNGRYSKSSSSSGRNSSRNNRGGGDDDGNDNNDEFSRQRDRYYDGGRYEKRDENGMDDGDRDDRDDEYSSTRSNRNNNNNNRRNNNRNNNNNDDDDDRDHHPRHQNSTRDVPAVLSDLPSRGGPTLATEEEFDRTKEMETNTTFESMHLRSELLKGLLQSGIIKPSNVQQRVMGPILSGRDVIAQSPSGTGKTTIIAIAMLQLVDPSINSPQALAIFPTRELARQTRVAMKALGSFMNVKVHTCIGGTSQSDDNKALEAGVHVVTGTPGRIFDNIKQGKLNTTHIKIWVIDEADEMFSKGFKDQIYYIYRFLPDQLQIVLVSATLPNDVLTLTSKFMTDPVRILVKRDELSLQGIKQFFVNVQSEDWKYDTLTDLYDLMRITQSVVFVNSREKCEDIAGRLKKANYTVDFMHGGMDQEQRDAVMDNFRSAKSRVLIATDIWGRGLDVQLVSLVINYDLPVSRESYLHRIGRSGRFGRKGVAINFCADGEKQVIDDIAQYYAIVIDELPQTLGSTDLADL